MKTAYELFHKEHPDEAATDRRGTFDTLSRAMAETGYQHQWEVGDQSWHVSIEARDHWLILAAPVPENDAESIALALEAIHLYSNVDGDHHKNWVFDQVVRHLARGRYEAWVEEQGDWDEGIAP